MTKSPSRESILLRRLFLGLLGAALVFGCICVVFAVLIDGFNDARITMRLVVTPTIVLFCGCIGLTGAMIHQTGRLVGYIRVMLGLLLVTCGFWLVVSWSSTLQMAPQADTYIRIGSSLTMVLLGMMFMGHLLIVESEYTLVHLATRALVVSIGGVVVVSMMMLWTEWWFPYGVYVGIVTAIWGSLTVLGALIVPMLARSLAKPRPQTAESIATKVVLEFSCPRCRAEQQLPTGLVRCKECRFALLIEIQEPRCACGYLLYQLRGETCPECGREVPQTDRWAAEAQAGSPNGP
ncbi:MAG: hypothetical protein V3T53_12160 [Phycisphaerales bacterium]